MIKRIFYTGKKVLIIIPIFLLTLYSLCNATEIDSILASGTPLTGAINRFNYNYELQVVFIGDLYPGDTGWPWIPPYVPNSPERAYLTFPLDSLFIPATANIDSVKLRLWAYNMVGNDNWGLWPIWDIPGGDTIKFCIDHIDYGNYLDVGDWTAGDPGDPQTLESKICFITPENYNPETWYIHVDVTNAVLDDIENGRDKSQFRLRFEIDSDMDSLYDYITICKFTTYPEHKPTLLSTNQIFLENYPNPFNQETTIQYQLPSNIKNSFLEIFNIKGELVRTYQCHSKTQIIWNGKDKYKNQVSLGFYFYRIKADDYVSKTNKMLLIK